MTGSVPVRGGHLDHPDRGVGLLRHLSGVKDGLEGGGVVVLVLHLDLQLVEDLELWAVLLPGGNVQVNRRSLNIIESTKDI